jgi:phage protein D
MSLNDPSQKSGVVRPRLRIVVANAPMPGCKSVSVTSNNNYSGDTFHADLAPPVGSAGTGSVTWWAAQDAIQVDVQMGQVPPGGSEAQTAWTSVLTGIVDQVATDPIQGTVSIDGRDLTALLRDSGPGGFDPNQTSSAIVTALATMNGLTPVVTATTGIVGRYYESDHKLTNLASAHHVANQWDAVVELARLEGFDAFVSGTELHFQPPVADTTDPWLVVAIPATATTPAKANVTGLKTTRALHIAKGIKVRVLSWHSLTAKAVNVTVGSGGNNAQQYDIVRPGLTEDQARNLANRYLLELSRHERTISGSAPGDFLLTPRVMMALEGTGTSFDQSYYPTTITRHIDEGGFVMEFTAKNQSPQALATAGAG